MREEALVPRRASRATKALPLGFTVKRKLGRVMNDPERFALSDSVSRLQRVRLHEGTVVNSVIAQQPIKSLALPFRVVRSREPEIRRCAQASRARLQPFDQPGVTQLRSSKLPSYRRHSLSAHAP